MLAEVKQKLKYLGVKSITPKSGNTFELIVLGDPINYQQFEFFKRNDLYIDGLKEQDDVTVTLKLSRNGFNTNTDLENIRKVG